jgi:hypothetical protein
MMFFIGPLVFWCFSLSEGTYIELQIFQKEFDFPHFEIPRHLEPEDSMIAATRLSS